MNKFSKYLSGAFGLMLAVGSVSCGSKTYMATLAPEESGLNMIKITDESKNTVLGVVLKPGSYGDAPFVVAGTNKKSGVSWGALRSLSVSPDGNEIAYMTRVKGQQNILVRSTAGSNASTQRTFRHVGDFSWGNDDNLYFIDMTDQQNKLCVIDAHAGTFMRQLTSNNLDYDPILSPDGKKVFFTRYEKNSGPSIWSYNLENGQLTNCAPGFHPTGISEDGNEFICVRNSDAGHSEIWRVNYVSGAKQLFSVIRKEVIPILPFLPMVNGCS